MIIKNFYAIFILILLIVIDNFSKKFFEPFFSKFRFQLTFPDNKYPPAGIL